MTDLLYRLRDAARGSFELSAEVLTVVTSVPHWVEERMILCGEPRSVSLSVTESLDAAWALAEAEGFRPEVSKFLPGRYTALLTRGSSSRHYLSGVASSPALAICAALVVAAEGKETHA